MLHIDLMNDACDTSSATTLDGQFVGRITVDLYDPPRRLMEERLEELLEERGSPATVTIEYQSAIATEATPGSEAALIEQERAINAAPVKEYEIVEQPESFNEMLMPPEQRLRDLIEKNKSAYKYWARCDRCHSEMGVNMYGMGTCPKCGYRRNP